MFIIELSVGAGVFIGGYVIGKLVNLLSHDSANQQPAMTSQPTRNIMPTTTSSNISSILNSKTTSSDAGQHHVYKKSSGREFGTGNPVQSNQSFNDPDNLYAILGIPRNASCTDINNAYSQLEAIYHPYITGNEHNYNLIKSAYIVLSDAYMKNIYDSNPIIIKSAANNLDNMLDELGI